MSERVHPVVDAHHHFWTPSRHDYYWMAGAELDPIRRTFGPDDLRPLLTAAGVDATVLVQTVPSVPETREFMVTAAATDFVAGSSVGSISQILQLRTRLPSCDPSPTGGRSSASGIRSMMRQMRSGCCDRMCNAAWRRCGMRGWPTTFSSAHASCRRRWRRRTHYPTCASSSTTSPNRRSPPASSTPGAR